MRVPGVSLPVLIVAAGLALGACSSAATPAPTPAPTTAASAAPSSAPVSPSMAPAASSAPASLPAGAEVTIGTGSSATLGAYLTGAGGMTLYIRTSDPAGGSSCTGGCASAWPPLTVAPGGHPLAGTGVTGTPGTFARSDGSLQVTYNGRALYYYAADTKPGDTSGQGVGGVWFVAPVSGSGGATSPAPSAPAEAPSAGASSSY
jgi:predicted lipoprotein with Yx(FWY)xxD motif